MIGTECHDAVQFFYQGEAMEKSKLFDEIIGSYSEEEWKALEDGTLGIPVNESNRRLLLDAKKTKRRYRGSAADEDIEKLRTALTEFLNETWADQPLAHRYVIDCCLLLTFLYEKPMHSLESVRYYTVVNDGKAEYYCPHKTDSIICGFCRSKYCDGLFSLWEEKVEETREVFGDTSAYIKKSIFESYFLESGIIETKDLVYHEDVRKQCEKNQCGAYGTTWACPPAVGTVEECRERVGRYKRMQLFSRSYVMQDTMDMKEALANMSDFKKCAGLLDKKLKEKIKDFLILSNESCGRCKTCTYPDAPCRFPEDLHHSIEGYGYYVLELARQAGIKYINGQKTVTFFGAVIYDE